MRIETVKITTTNAMNVLVSEDLYLIKKSKWDKKGFEMVQVKNCEVGEILDENNVIVRVVTDDKTDLFGNFGELY